MITARAWAGKRYAVLGLARSGAATVRALVASGAAVQAWDDDEGRRAFLSPLPFRGGVGGGASPQATPPAEAPHPNPSPKGEELEIAPLDDLTGFDALVLSPGVPLNTHPLAAKARAAGVPIIGDIELFAQARAELPPHKVVGITGTNGKSTTTALVHHTLQTAGVPSLMGGNIGLPILAQEPLPAGGVYVLELSSYQIDLTQTLDCDVAVLLNITPDHLDRYDGFEGYVASKARLFEMQSADNSAVIGVDDPTAHRVFFDTARARSGTVVVGRSAAELTEEYFWGNAGDKVFDVPPTRQVDWPSLSGPHNAGNAAIAIDTARLLGVDVPSIVEGLRTFTGLPHRTELIATRAGVAFVDDSKATNPDSTAPALAAFPRVHWILGGRAKGDDLDACLPHLPHVARAYTIGEAGPVFARVLDGRVPVEQAETLDRAVASAAANASEGDTVLLSPAAASFDQFRDYEDRGRAFRRLVEAL